MRWTLAIVGLFAFRLLFGLCSEFFFEDQTQIFLLGLRFHATGQWPYFGPDVVWTQSQIPGALQALLVGIPLSIAPIPESPFVLLNVLSLASIAWLAWYIGQRLPTLPRWLVWGWLPTIPWTLQFATTMINPSYVLPAAIVFFIGFFEAHPKLTLGRISSPIAHFMMGAAITWVMQVHMSWPLMLPYVALIRLARRHDAWRRVAVDLAALAVGAAVPGALILPTLLRYGLQAGTGGTGRNLHLHVVNPWMFVTTLARFLSFASLEVNRFIGIDGAKRVVFVARHLWIAPLLASVLLVGLVHPIVLAWLWFRRAHPDRADWTTLRALVAGTVVLVFLSYWFVMEPPQAHAFYVVAPVALIYAAYCWSFVDTPRWRRVAAVVLVVNIAFHLGLALAKAPEISLYKNRAVVAAAVASRNPDLFAHRRAFAMDARPGVDAGVLRDPRADVEVVEPACAPHAGGAAVWEVKLRNRSDRRAYRDLVYRATYLNADGQPMETRFGRILDIIQPGEVRAARMVDPDVPASFSRATLDLVLAEELEPMGTPAP